MRVNLENKSNLIRMVGFLCNECGKSFAEDIDLALHERRTHDKRTFPCEKCGETLVGQSKYSKTHNQMRVAFECHQGVKVKVVK